MSDSECGRNDHTKCIVAKQSVVIGKFCGFLLGLSVKINVDLGSALFIWIF